MLTKRENQILALNAAGLSVKEIAAHIDRSEYTVQKTISNIKEKTGLQKATELVALYFCQKSDIDFGEFRRQSIAQAKIYCDSKGNIRILTHNTMYIRDSRNHI